VVFACCRDRDRKRSRKSSRKSQLDMWMEESSSDEEFVEEDEEEERRRADQLVSDTDHWLIQKLIRYIKVCSFLHLLLWTYYQTDIFKK